MAKKKIKNLGKTNAATTAHYLVLDKEDSVGPYLISVADFLSLFGFNAVNYRVTEFPSGGSQNASGSFDVYVFLDAGVLQLPTAASLYKKPVIIKNLTTNKVVTVKAASGEFVDFDTEFTIDTADSETLVPITGGFIKI